jgi:hypothetical protein
MSELCGHRQVTRSVRAVGCGSTQKSRFCRSSSFAPAAFDFASAETHFEQNVQPVAVIHRRVVHFPPSISARIAPPTRFTNLTGRPATISGSKLRKLEKDGWRGFRFRIGLL